MCNTNNSHGWLDRILPNGNPFLSSRPRRDVEVEDCSILSVLKVDLCQEENHVRHHTSHFHSADTQEALVVRRGQPFRLRIHFDRDFSPSKDTICFIGKVADDPKPTPGHGTFIALLPKNGTDNLGDPSEWGAGIESHEGQTLSVLIKPPSTCPVAEWKLDIDTVSDRRGSCYSLSEPLYVLFNPYCPDDQVFLKDHDQRKEYVKNDTTLIYNGSYNSICALGWKLGQYERDVLKCSLRILGTIGGLSPAHRGDPVFVARTLSAVINCNDDRGILVGNWEEVIEDGVKPTKWTGSAEIIQQFYKSKEPVRYGQCWVYGGVLATMARSLGIPTRIITCFNSAHDKDGSATLDVFYDADGKEKDDGDSNWNFHVWNECWMKRPDFGVGKHGSYDGWQVVDATPQVESGGKCRLGPGPVLAVKHGELQKPYDIGYIFAEVNADMVFWRYNGKGHPLKLIRTDTQYVGKNISTKAVLKFEREDVTDNYKFAERSKEERNALAKVLKELNNSLSRFHLNSNFNEVEFDLQLEDDINMGENFKVVLRVTNKSWTNTHVAEGSIVCQAVKYTGKDGEMVKATKFNLELKPQSTGYVRMEVRFTEYFEKLPLKGALRIAAVGKVKDTDYEYSIRDNFHVHMPTIEFQLGEGNLVVHKKSKVIMSLKNPLPIPLRKGVFIVEGPGIKHPLKLKIAEVPMGGNATADFEYTPPYYGHVAMVAKFSCKELDEVDGYKDFIVAQCCLKP
ncbi:LOW QUALITY PROTEIN: annulin-like [Drosophila ficusphila]|uniref:LOW QUALITY PROTEIN: annulin-like n=1 Tax=Drosophila ficusphila TaxID=30025 RepID=UPI001C8A3968|nr:LOW QUALITY PROTEIN: annulin-like [Drosophila ficusphila]